MRWPWQKRESEPRVEALFNFMEAEVPPDPDSPSVEWDIRMEVPLRLLAALFAERGWHLLMPGKGPQPSSYQLAEVLTEMVSHLEDTDSFYMTLARFLAIRDEDFPGAIDLYVHVGTATIKTTEEQDTV